MLTLGRLTCSSIAAVGIQKSEAVRCRDFSVMGFKCATGPSPSSSAAGVGREMRRELPVRQEVKLVSFCSLQALLPAAHNYTFLSFLKALFRVKDLTSCDRVLSVTSEWESSM